MEGKSQKRLKVVATTKDAPRSQSVPLTQAEQVESSMPTKVKRKIHSTKHVWTKQEDAALVDCLVELSKDSTWKSENGFRTRYFLHLEKLMAAKVPSSNLKATPHIESRYKLLKRQFYAINEMLNHSSGFEGNDVEKCITATKDVFDDWSHSTAIGLRNKEFPYFDDLMSVWGNDLVTGAGAESPADAVEEINLYDEEVDTFERGIDEQTEGHEYQDYVRDEKRKSEMETPDLSVCSSSNKSTTIKKKRNFNDVLVDLVGEICKYVTTVIEANEEMKGISTYFKQQTESYDRKMRIYDELMELSDFSRQEIMDVGEYILKDEYKVDNFFALPKAFRRDYVVKQLSKINPY